MLASWALCHKKGRRQGHCVFLTAFLQFCSFFQCLAERGQRLALLSGFSLLSVLSMVPIYKQTDTEQFVCLKKRVKGKKGKILLFPVQFLQLGHSPHKERFFLKKCCIIQTVIYLWPHQLSSRSFFPGAVCPLPLRTMEN